MRAAWSQNELRRNETQDWQFRGPEADTMRAAIARPTQRQLTCPFNTELSPLSCATLGGRRDPDENDENLSPSFLRSSIVCRVR